MGAPDNDMPQTLHAANEGALRAQRRYFVRTALYLVALTVAAVCGALTGITPASPTDWASIAGAACFLAAGVVRTDLLRSRPDRAWYEARVIAETVRSLAWKFAVRGHPFSDSRPDAAVEADLIAKLRTLTATAQFTDILPVPEKAMQITAAMRKLRSQSLEGRKVAYDEGRLQDKQAWYAAKAKWHRRRFEGWNHILTVAEVAGVTAAVLRASGVVKIDLLGVVGAIVASATAWLQAKQHQTLAGAYSIAGMELAFTRELTPSIADEDEWSRFVDESEDIINREHTIWKLSRSI